ncbi:type II toxin-antitoxin system prevent-host-death family antitoxin [Fodinibius sp.]|uniref:type II toxin-antitoxin system Phd/YefM family antitoxin n=1 Tax=Fodinibius sp. TaxID=1872440 RepID=UPI002ACDCC6E|nr:type II toxin-antitoxin system prevent-host-death family antitoxin [Fodinibius sp.]MDZ7659437.1 type II toxin-antitoxin system prevent-host-death family antitoxin [Fodinibius sp.]
MKATTKDLRLHSKDILNAVRRGEEITITYRGKPTAVMSPIKASGRRRRMNDAPAFGIWKDHDKDHDVQHYIDQARRPRF